MPNEISKIKLPNEQTAREVKDTTARQVFTPATSSTSGTQGQVPAPTYAEVTEGAYLKADGTWDTPAGGTTPTGDDIILTGYTQGSDTSAVAATDKVNEAIAKHENKLAGKVDKVTGKGLSSNDYTNDEKDKLSNIEAGAEVNVQADWNQTTSTADDYIKNKPTLGTAAAANTTDFATAAQGTKADNAVPSSAKGVANGVASLDSSGKVPSSQLPSYVDDVLEYSAKSSFPATGETGKIYVDTTTNKTYRWGGSAYVEISESLALGDTSSTAYYGDKGKTAYEHSQLTSGNPHNVTASDVGLGSVGNFKAVSTVASQGLSDQEKIDARANIGAGTSSLVIGTAATQAAAGNHTHGNITNAGALQTTDASIATGDKLVVTDASNSNKVARTSAAFDTTVTTKCLTQAGTFADFNNYSHPTTAGNKHIPTSGATGNYLKYGGSSGTAAWAAPLTSWPATPTNTDTLPSTKLIADRFTTNESNISSVQNDVNILKLSEFNNAFGMKISKSDTNPDTKVSYMFNAEGMTPAHMDFTGGSFNFGSFSSWKPVSQNRPVGLNFDGSVAYELNHTDFSKKLDGTASDITDATTTINFMSEMPLMYVRRWEDENYNYIVFCEYQTNENYTADAFKNASGGIGSKLYLPMFKGSYVDGKLRSLAKQYWQNNADVQGAEAEWNAAAACGTGWQTWDWAKREYLSDLMTFITKSTDWKNKFGRGVTNRSTSNNNKYDGQPTGGYCSTSGDLTTWTADYHGQFYGVASTTSDKKHVTAFYVEDPYGNRWERTPGLELYNNVYRVKMSPPYALTDSASRAEYDNLGISAPAEGWFKVASTSVHGSVPVAVGASETTGYCSYFYKNASSVRLVLFGGACNFGGGCGRYVDLSCAPSYSFWDVGASPCFVSP